MVKLIGFGDTICNRELCSQTINQSKQRLEFFLPSMDIIHGKIVVAQR